MLWDVIFEFFVKYIFGGRLDAGAYQGTLGATLYNNEWVRYNTTYSYVELFGMQLPLGNYFSFIATLISMVAIVLICCLLIKKIYNMCAHIIG